MMPHRLPSRRGRSHWQVLGFLAASTVVLIIVAERYLIPAFGAAHGADAIARKQLSAISWLVLVIVLVTLLGMLLLVLRPGRFLFPRKPDARSRTRYSDAWSESARRMQTPPPEEDDDTPK